MKFTKTMKRIFVSLFSALFCVTLALCLSVGSFFTADAAETVKTTTNMTTNGASIRLANDGQSGIRFHVRVKSNASRQAILDTTYSEEEFLNLTSGILLIPSNKLPAGEELTLSGATTAYASGAKAANVTGENCVWEFEQSGSNYYYEATAYIYNIPVASYEKDFTFRGYFTSADGTTYYTENTNNTRSLSYVALRAKMEDIETKATAGETAGYQGDLFTQLNDFLPARLVNDAAKFVNKDTYLYRVGNGNTVAVSSLFDTSLVAGLNAETLVGSMNDYITVNSKVGNVTCEIKGTDAASATLQFSGTGVIELVVNSPALYTRGESASKTTMLFEVVNANNATSAASATKNNVVLLNDVGLYTLEVSNGYVLYGNGFKMTATNDIMDYDLGSGFVSLNGGTLDNVQIICPNPSYAVMWNKNRYDSGNVHKDNNPDTKIHGNMRSAVLVSSNSTIVNSYISGGRAAIYLRGITTLTVDNTTIDGGAVANIYAGAGTSLVLRDATLIQEPKQATVYDTSKTLIGLSVLAESDSTATPSITLEGKLVQYAWVNSDYTKYVPSEATSIANLVLKKTAYKHSITYKDGVQRDSVNLGIAFMNMETGAVKKPEIKDNRTNQSLVPYALETVSTAYVYTYKNSNGTADEFKTIPAYEPTEQAQSTVLPTVSYNGTTTGITNETTYSAELGWNTKLTCDLDVLKNFTFKFNSITAKKNNQNLDYTVTDAAGNVVDKSIGIVCTESNIAEYVLTIKDNQGYDAQGNQLPAVEYKYHFTLVVTKTSIKAPEKVAEPGGTPLMVVKSKNSDWSCAIPALEGTQIEYYNKTSKQYETLALSSLTPSKTGKQNKTNNFWEYSDPNGNFTLKVTCGYIHDTKKIYGMPVVVNNSGNKMYFTISSTSGYVSTSTASRTVTITYDFTDSNGVSLSFNKTWQFNYSDYSSKQYSYSDFCNGTLKEASSGTCLTADTLITLADGTQKFVADLQAGDMLLVFNHYTGKLDVKPFVVNAHADEEAQLYNVLNVEFSNGALWRIVGTHGIFDCTLNEYVMISWENIDEFIGHEFYYTDGVNSEYVEMTGYYITEEYTKVYSPGTADFINYFANGLLNAVPFPDTYTAGQMNYFDFDENMMYDEAQMQADIETYGLYTYEDFADYIPEELFNVFPFKYLKISVGKGLMTWDDIIHLIEVVFAE